MLYLKLREILSILVDRLKKLPGVQEIVLFGSVAEDRYRPDSDVDVLVILDKEISRKFFHDIAGDIYINYGIPVTIILVTIERLREGKDPWLRRIVEEGKVLWRRKIE
ncbi:MAG: nucleotidyltransferase domain-containing protein [Candidatus Njordarchaeales archaeon]